MQECKSLGWDPNRSVKLVWISRSVNNNDMYFTFLTLLYALCFDKLLQHNALELQIQVESAWTQLAAFITIQNSQWSWSDWFRHLDGQQSSHCSFFNHHKSKFSMRVQRGDNIQMITRIPLWVRTLQHWLSWNHKMRELTGYSKKEYSEYIKYITLKL